MTPQVAAWNESTKRQARWVEIPMPCSQADAMGQHAIIDGRFIATKGPRLADHTQMWHARIDLQGGAVGPLSEWTPWPSGVPFPSYVLSPWITDNLLKMRLYADIIVGAGEIITLGPDTSELIYDGAALKLWEFKGSRNGLHLTTWGWTWSGQDAVDFAAVIHLSNPTDIAWRRRDVTIELRTGGEPLAVMPRRTVGYKATNIITLYADDDLPHGYPVKVRGVIGAMPEAGPHGVDEHRLDALWAAREGKIWAAAKWVDGEWLAFGVVPDTNERPSAEEWLAYRNGKGSYHESRKLALDPKSGQTGAQWPFSATVDAVVLQGRPVRMPFLVDGADDPRGIYHTEMDGTPITMVTRPGLETWCGLIDVNSQDMLGKSRNPPSNWNIVGPRDIGADDQHAGNGGLAAAYALTGCPMLADTIRRVVAVHETRAFARRWRPSNPKSWLDAPRATGRILQDTAKFAMLMKGDIRDRIIRLAVRELEMWRAAIPTTGDVRPCFTITDPRVLPGLEASMPWQDSLLALGLLEQYHAFRKMGLTETAQEFLDLAVAIGRNVVQWGFVQTAWGAWEPINGLKVNPDGSANPPSYYTYPRAGASTMTGPGVDLLIGDDGWYSWFSAALVSAQHGPDDPVKLRARMLWQNSHHGLGKWAEWFAIPVPQ